MANQFQLVVDCHSPGLLLPFWSAALGYVSAEPPAGHDTWRSYYLSIGEAEEALEDGDCCDRLVDPEGRGPSIWFQVVPERKAGKNRVHLDVHVTNRSLPWPQRRQQLASALDRLTALGGQVRTPVPDSDSEHLACGINDPEGNELCLV